ncbi:MAG TPA: Ku protein [Caldimonas sp.]|nr:Ku protein [Caldimonas sp.]HEX2539902.1 Ku protein [Caldimonas sp.]
MNLAAPPSGRQPGHPAPTWTPPPARPEPPRSDSERAAPAPAVVERSEMVKGYEFEPGQFVLFEPEELKALAEAARQTIDIVAFLPEHSVDPIYYDKAYFLAPDKRGGKPYSLLRKAMRESGRCALAKWAWRSKQYMVQIRPVEGGLVLQQLLYADEVRSIDDLGIDLVEVGAAELELAVRLIEQISLERYDPTQYVDEEKERILAAVREKIAGRQVVVEHPPEPRTAPTAQVIDLVAALRASLRAPPAAGAGPSSDQAAGVAGAKERKPVRRAGTAAGKSASAKAEAKAEGKAQGKGEGKPATGAGARAGARSASGKR